MPVAIAAPLLSGSYNGLAFGPGTDFHLGSVTAASSTASIALETGISGLDDLPPIRSSDAPRGQDIGSWRGLDFVDARTIHLEFEIIAADNPTLYSDIALLEAAFTPQQSGELPLLLFNSTRQINCRVRSRSVPYDTGQLPRIGGMIVELLASDPRIYDANLTTLVLIPSSGTVGASWNWAWNLSWGGASTSGTGTAVNAGNYGTRPVIAILGPCTNPYIQNVTTGALLSFSISLGASDTLTIDTDAHSILLNGSASRYAALISGSQWFELAPGTTGLKFGAGSFSGGSQATVTFRNAWM